jgi:hypothetical protein
VTPLRHSSAGGNPARIGNWVPAFAGMTCSRIGTAD